MTEVTNEPAIEDNDENEDDSSTGKNYGSVTVKAKKKDAAEGEAKEASYSFELGTDLEDCVAQWGEEVVYYHFCIGAKKSLQNKLYSLLNADGLSVEQAKKALEKWEPSIGPERGPRDPKLAALSAVDRMDDATRAAFIEELKRKLGM